MALTQKLQLRQSHALVMTPQLMQAIKLLQLSNLDLVGYVESELERNPLLERESGRRRRGRAGMTPRRRRTSRRRRRCWTRCRPRPTATPSERLDIAGDDVSPTRRRQAAPRTSERRRAIPTGPAPAPAAADGDYNLEAFVSAERTLADHLAEQLVLAVADPARRLIGQYLIDLVDEAGYLAGDLAARRRQARRPVAEVEAMLASCRPSIRPALRAQPHRMPRDPAARAQPLRSGHAGAGRPSRSAGEAGFRRA